MAEEIIPIMRAADALANAEWYERLGFRVVGEHRFGPDFPLYVFLVRGDVHLHLSEHAGDATTNTLVYLWVDDVDAVAAEFDVEVAEQPWAREVELTDPDGRTGSAWAPVARADPSELIRAGRRAG